MDIQLIDTNTCDPLPDIYTDLWHCNATVSDNRFFLSDRGICFNQLYYRVSTLELAPAATETLLTPEISITLSCEESSPATPTVLFNSSQFSLVTTPVVLPTFTV